MIFELCRIASAELRLLLMLLMVRIADMERRRHFIGRRWDLKALRLCYEVRVGEKWWIRWQYEVSIHRLPMRQSLPAIIKLSLTAVDTLSLLRYEILSLRLIEWTRAERVDFSTLRVLPYRITAADAELLDVAARWEIIVFDERTPWLLQIGRVFQLSSPVCKPVADLSVSETLKMI